MPATGENRQQQNDRKRNPTEQRSGLRVMNRSNSFHSRPRLLPEFCFQACAGPISSAETSVRDE